MAAERVEQLKSILAQDPGNTFARYALGMEYMSAGETGPALQEFRSVLEVDANYANAFFMGAQALQQAEASPVRLTVLMLASLIAPAVLFIQSLAGQYHDDSVIAVFSALLYLLVLSRLWDVAASHRRALGRERAVRLAGASLASAVTVQEAATTVRGAAVEVVALR